MPCEGEVMSAWEFNDMHAFSIGGVRSGATGSLTRWVGRLSMARSNIKRHVRILSGGWESLVVILTSRSRIDHLVIDQNISTHDPKSAHQMFLEPPCRGHVGIIDFQIENSAFSNMDRVKMLSLEANRPDLILEAAKHRALLVNWAFSGFHPIH